MSSWNKAQTMELLQLYEQFPSLYNVQHSDYTNRVKRSKCLEEIRSNLKEVRPEITINDIKSKIKTLRSQYLKEKNNITISKKSGAGFDDVYVPRLWCFDQLAFFDNFHRDVPSESNIPFLSKVNGNEFGDNSSFLEEESSNEFLSPAKEKLDSFVIDAAKTTYKAKSKTALEIRVAKSLDAADNLIKDVQSKATQQTRESDLAKIVEIETRNLSDEIFFDAKFKIMEILLNAQKENFTQKRRSSSFSPISFSKSVGSNISLSSTPKIVRVQIVKPPPTATPPPPYVASPECSTTMDKHFDFDNFSEETVPKKQRSGLVMSDSLQDEF